MKKIFPVAVLSAGMLVLASCSDFLDQKSPSEQDTENVYNSEYYTSLQINKIYGQLTQDRTYSQDFAFIYLMNSDCELVDGLGSDATNTSSERGNMNYNSDPGWSKLSNSWTAMYDVIEQANLAIDGIENHSSISDESSMQRYLGEARVLRAMTYFDLLRTFGDIPMKLEPTKTDLSNAYLGKTDRDTIMDTLMVDLEKAIDELPWAGQNSYTTEHVTKGYAHALLAQIALTRAGYAIREKAKDGYETASYSDDTYPTQRPGSAKRKELYELALEHLTAVITSGVHQLNPSFKNEWYLLNQLTLDETYRENLFEIPMLRNVSGELGYTVGVRMNGITSEYGYGNSSGKMKVTAPLFYSYKDSDLRRDITCSPIQIKEDKDVNGNTATVEQNLGNAPFGLYVGKWDPRMESDTWLAENKAASAKHMTGINVVKIRYSQVLLWYAEVMNELAGPDGRYSGDAGMTARQALAMVHERAYDSANLSIAQEYINSLPSDKDGFFDAIVDENAWELAGEGARKFDLIRWNLLVDKIKEMKTAYLEELQDGTYQETVYFNYSNTAHTKLDMSSMTWNGLPSGKSESDYDGSFTSFGGSDVTKTSDKQVYVNLPSISSGLVPTTVSGGTITFSEPTVKNRYLMPIASTTISASNGTLHNSYGFSD
ncbi:MAG: RagB/SusD family nutrient uptake outer membrane protein [Prevotella sp.]|jgi:hypothetical protein